MAVFGADAVMKQPELASAEIQVGDAATRQPVGDAPLAARLHKGAVVGADRLVQLDARIEVAALQVHLVEAAVAEAALEGALRAGELVRLPVASSNAVD